MEISETDCFDILTIQNDQISYVKHVLDPLYVFFTPFGCVCVGGGGAPKGSRAHNLLMQFSGLGSSKMEISETDFFDIFTIQNDQISYVKHVLAPLPSSRCLAEGNRIFCTRHILNPLSHGSVRQFWVDGSWVRDQFRQSVFMSLLLCPLPMSRGC